MFPGTEHGVPSLASLSLCNENGDDVRVDVRLLLKPALFNVRQIPLAEACDVNVVDVGDGARLQVVWVGRSCNECLAWKLYIVSSKAEKEGFPYDRLKFRQVPKMRGKTAYEGFVKE